MGFLTRSPGSNFQSLPQILGRVAYPVEPFGFKFVSNRLLPPVLEGIRDSLRKQPNLLDQLDDRHTNELQ